MSKAIYNEAMDWDTVCHYAATGSLEIPADKMEGFLVRMALEQEYSQSELEAANCEIARLDEEIEDSEYRFKELREED